MHLKPTGALRNNRNPMRHGLRGGQLPKDARYIELCLNAFRQTLEDAVFEGRGRVTSYRRRLDPKRA